eukprot:3142716-Rhodomonas_salina.1
MMAVWSEPVWPSQDMMDVATIQKAALDLNHQKTFLHELGAAVCKKVALPPCLLYTSPSPRDRG